MATPSSTATSWALAGRLAGSFSSSVATTARRSTGTSSASGGGGSLTCDSAVAIGVPAVEGARAGEHLVRDDAEGVEVAGAGRRLAHRLLGADVVGGAEHLADAGVADGVHGAGDAEVGQLHHAVLAHEDVGGLDVAVHDAGLVGGAERERGLGQDRADDLGRQRALLADDRRERLAGDELHHEVGEVVVLAVVEDRGDVGVHQRRRVEGLVAEALREDLLVVGVGAHDLDRDQPLEHVVERAPDVGHAAGGDPLLQDVAVPETESCLESLHGVCPTSFGYGTRTAPLGMLPARP